MTFRGSIARLVLEDGSVYQGYSFGSQRNVAGEVVFNTGMVGYPESLTDPSYHGQILVLTYPLIGNYGVPDESKEDRLMKLFESEKIQVQGLIISDYSGSYSHWNAKQSLSAWLKEHRIPALYDVDTRALTKKIRTKGTMLGKILCTKQKLRFADPNKRNLVAEVSISTPTFYERSKKRVVLVDCGVKHSIIRSLLDRNISVMRVPWDYDFTKETVDGIVLSNGPGDPKQCTATIENTKKALSRSTPILGICLGSQILGLAAGANTYKLKFGHRSHNQPCIEVGTRRCHITPQNHGYAIRSNTLPVDWREWFYNNNDGTNEGIIHVSKPFFGAQFHPEASPGPDDTAFLFDLFVRAIR
ncbi:carbamoyl phosphate synthase small subunit [candidate division WOR_3 bacterium SM23_60]|uniref:Carbamoyl phosphate synthase small chain n=1 Tax=candidate division WOR_3 bacterium SM23_60 TaxID=1703780 RepID=A0A0S8GIV4_UNCW3|nr:MAG: carbamoyl phosphate synthase small subunit [candidate division WOR_3 bacterium SM23_60]